MCEIILAVMFILPGWHVWNVLAFIAKEYQGPGKLPSCLVYGFVNVGFWVLVYRALAHLGSSSPVPATFDGQTWPVWSAIVALSLVTSTATAYCLGKIHQDRVFPRLVKRLFKLRTVDPTETAWDYLFSKCESARLLITLKDGEEISGWFAEKSFASSRFGDRDIYIQHLYDDNETKRSIYIPKDTIKYIKIIDADGIPGENDATDNPADAG
jgi:hypothetical protein